MTFLRSHDADPSALVAFIEANWFAMDRIAQSRGLMTGYSVSYAPRADDAWNVVVTVQYPTCAGYDAIITDFAAIRSQHTTVPINGASRVSDMGAITGTRRLHPPGSGC